MTDIGPWHKVFSLRYRSQRPVTPQRFGALMTGIGETVGQQIEEADGDHIFSITVGGIDCMASVSLTERDPIRECRFTVLTTSSRLPTDMTRAEGIHAMIEACFTDLGPACGPGPAADSGSGSDDGASAS